MNDTEIRLKVSLEMVLLIENEYLYWYTVYSNGIVYQWGGKVFCTDPNSNPSVGRYLINFCCWVTDGVVQGCCKGVFGYCIGGRVFFGGHGLIGVLSFLSKYRITILL